MTRSHKTITALKILDRRISINIKVSSILRREIFYLNSMLTIVTRAATDQNSFVVQSIRWICPVNDGSNGKTCQFHQLINWISTFIEQIDVQCNRIFLTEMQNKSLRSNHTISLLLFFLSFLLLYLFTWEMMTFFCSQKVRLASKDWTCKWLASDRNPFRVLILWMEKVACPQCRVDSNVYQVVNTADFCRFFWRHLRTESRASKNSPASSSLFHAFSNFIDWFTWKSMWLICLLNFCQ